jgi:hypothetical protein
MATYDIEALKQDLPTAKDLAQFVYDRVGLALDLIGKPKDEQYTVAKRALEGKNVPAEYVTQDNPYVDKRDLIPEDPMPPAPEREKDLPDLESRVHFFGATNMPHPLDPQSDRKVHISFRKYENGALTYEVVGPLEKQAIGSRINKYGQNVPERHTWLDPRSGEKMMRRPDGTMTTAGRGLYTYCVGEKGGGIWPLIDREQVAISAKNIADPWA